MFGNWKMVDIAKSIIFQDFIKGVIMKKLIIVEK